MSVEGTKGTSGDVLLEVAEGEVGLTHRHMRFLFIIIFSQSNKFLFDLPNLGEVTSLTVRMADDAKTTWQPISVRIAIIDS